MSPSTFPIRMAFFFRDDLLYLFRFCGNSFYAMVYSAEERNVSPDSHHTDNHHDSVSRPVLFGEEEFVHHRLYKIHKHRNKQTFYQEFHAKRLVAPVI